LLESPFSKQNNEHNNQQLTQVFPRCGRRGRAGDINAGSPHMAMVVAVAGVVVREVAAGKIIVSIVNINN
jgi:hypothetical protein